jgi:hypothetical protein
MAWSKRMLGTVIVAVLTFGGMGQSVPLSDLQMAQADGPSVSRQFPGPISALSWQLGNSPSSPGGTGYRQPRQRILTCHRVRYPSPHEICGW